jgi:hypothetical protein
MKRIGNVKASAKENIEESSANRKQHRRNGWRRPLASKGIESGGSVAAWRRRQSSVSKMSGNISISVMASVSLWHISHQLKSLALAWENMKNINENNGSNRRTAAKIGGVAVKKRK